MMKDRKLKTICLLLAAALLLSACGGAGEPAESADGTPPPEVEPTPPVAIPPEFVGTWISMNSAQDVLVFAEDGTLRANGKEIEITGAEEGRVEYRFGQAAGTVSFVEGYLSCGFPLPLSERSEFAFFYRQGTENPSERFAGTWTLCAGEGNVWNGAAVEEFSISEAGELILGEETYPVSPQMIFNGPNDCDWVLRTADDRIWCSFFDDEPDALSLGTGEGWGRYYKDVRTAELTLDNWKDFFEVVISYSLRRDGEGGVRNAMTRVFLAEKGDVDILRVTNGRASVASSPTAYAMIEYDLETGTHQLRSIAVKERWKYNSKYFQDYRNRKVEDVFKEFGKGIPSDDDPEDVSGWALCFIVISEEKPIVEGNIVTAPTITEVYLQVKQIRGTILYREKD